MYVNVDLSPDIYEEHKFGDNGVLYKIRGACYSMAVAFLSIGDTITSFFR